MRAVVIIIWLILGQLYYIFHQRSTRTCCVSTPEISLQELKKSHPLLFRIGDDTLILGEKHQQWRDSVLALVQDKDQYLRIVGYYSPDEATPTDATDMGMVRARRLMALLVPPLDSGQVELHSAQLSEVPDSPYFSTYEMVLQRRPPPLETTKRIYFEYGKNQPIRDTQLLHYLDRVAEYLLATGKKVYLTGHTDNISSRKFNYALGLRRARKIADYLKSRGVPDSLIVVQSAGEDQPIAPNTTEEGRQKNRRVELEIKD